MNFQCSSVAFPKSDFCRHTGHRSCLSSSRIDLQGRMSCPKRPGHIRHWLAAAPDRPCIPSCNGYGQLLEQAFAHRSFGRALRGGNLSRQPMKHRSSSFGVAPLRFQDNGLIDDSRSLARASVRWCRRLCSSYASAAPAEASLVASRWLGPRALMTAKSRASG